MEVQDCPCGVWAKCWITRSSRLRTFVAAEATGADYRWPAWRQPDQSRWRRCDRSQLPAPRHCSVHVSNFVINLQSDAYSSLERGELATRATNGPGYGERCDHALA